MDGGGGGGQGGLHLMVYMSTTIGFDWQIDWLAVCLPLCS